MMMPFFQYMESRSMGRFGSRCKEKDGQVSLLVPSQCLFWNG